MYHHPSHTWLEKFVLVTKIRQLARNFVSCPFCPFPGPFGKGGGAVPQSCYWSCPKSWLGGGTPTWDRSTPRTGHQLYPPPPPDRTGSTPTSLGTGQGYPQDTTGVPLQGLSPGTEQGLPSPTTENQDGCVARAVCLLRSRRTSLFFWCTPWLDQLKLVWQVTSVT